MRKTWPIASTLESMLKWDRTTPLGSPSLPLLKMTATVSFTEIRRVAPAAFSSSRIGARQASARASGPVDPADRGADVLDPDHLDAVGQLERRPSRGRSGW